MCIEVRKTQVEDRFSILFSIHDIRKLFCQYVLTVDYGAFPKVT